MEVKAESMLIDTVFQKGKYIIPEYQREYDWTEENITEFINDINEIEEKDRYFIGHIVLEGDFNGNEFKVIDGQQRITTITILLCVIRDLFVEKGFQNLADGLNENYIFSKDRDNNKFVVLENKMPYPLLHKYVQNYIERLFKENKKLEECTVNEINILSSIKPSPHIVKYI